MASELFTSWGEYQAAIDRILALAQRELRIYDADLGQLRLETPERLERLHALLAGGQPECLKIAVRDAAPFRDRSPRLTALMRTRGHLVTVVETPESIAHLRDSMILADGRHALIRFDQDQPRCKLLMDDEDAVSPYLRRFEEILLEGGAPIGATVLGL